MNGFEEFWKAYPKRRAKADARKAWAKLAPDAELLAVILKALAWQTREEQWNRDGGQYIPLPASWLRGERYEDEPALAKPEPVKREVKPCAKCEGEGLYPFQGQLLCSQHYVDREEPKLKLVRRA